MILGLLILTELKVGPAKGIGVSPVVGIQCHCLANEIQCLVEILPIFGPHITEVVESRCKIGLDLEKVLKKAFGLGKSAAALERCTKPEHDLDRVLIELVGLLQYWNGLTVAFEPLVDLGDIQKALDIAGVGQLFDSLVGLLIPPEAQQDFRLFGPDAP